MNSTEFEYRYVEILSLRRRPARTRDTPWDTFEGGASHAALLQLRAKTAVENIGDPFGGSPSRCSARRADNGSTSRQHEVSCLT